MTDNLSFTAKITYIPYFDEKSSWGVLDVVTEQNLPHSRKTFDFDLDTNQTIEKYSTRLVGKLPTPHIGQEISVLAYHEYNTKFKRDQYTIVQLTSKQPKTQAENIAYLKSLVTDNQAESLLKSYPNIVQEIIDGVDNVDLNLLPGIGKITYDKIKDKVIENFAISDILGLLVPLGVSFSKIQKLMDGERNPQILKEKIIKNPYCLTSIPGISFITADKIAIQLNPILKESEERLIAFVSHYLRDIGEQFGDTYTEINELKSAVIDGITECDKFFDKWIEKEKLANNGSGNIVHVENDSVGLKWFWLSEKFIIDKILELNSAIPLEVTEESILSGIEKAEKKLGFQFTQEQIDVIKMTSTKNFSILTSMAGCGKTTITRGIIEVYEEMGYSIYLASLSAKAAIRSRDVTNHETATIHRMLGSNGIEFEFDKDHKLPCDVLILEECSMTNTSLFRSVLEAVDTEMTKVIFVGDFKQLPPISAGNTFYDLIVGNPYNLMITELTKIQRQAEDSAIIVDGNKIRLGINPVPNKEPKIVHGKSNDLYYIFKQDKEDIFTTAVSSYISSVKQKGIDNVIVLCPRKKDTLNSTFELNKAIQKRINYENKDNKFIHGDKSFWLIDKVTHLKNDYKRNVFNGEIGTVVRINVKDMVVKYLDKEITYTHEDIIDLDLSYAVTVHKAQGDEREDVILVLDNSHFKLLSNQLIYTGITRAKSRCMIIAQPFAFDKGLEENATQRKTWTKNGGLLK